MDLDEFIASTLTQIAAGVRKASEELVGNHGPWVAPFGSELPPLQGFSVMTMPAGESAYLQSVEFDVAITTTDKSEGGARGGIRIAAFDASGGKSKSNENTAASRIQFRVPFVLPGTRFATREDRLHNRR